MRSVSPVRMKGLVPAFPALLSLMFCLLTFCLLIFCSILPSQGASDAPGGGGYAPDFEASDVDGNLVKLSELQGQPLILHITNIEVPLCIECEEALRGQVEELSRLAKTNPDAEIVTINLRKNPYSEDGRTLAESWWEVEIPWPWIEDFDPYPVAGRYIDYWSLHGGFANPTLILVDDDGRISEVYQVYLMGEGMVDGVKTAESLKNARQGPTNSGDAGAIGPLNPLRDVTFLGMFGLGIVTSLAPCSLALLIAVFSYLMTSHRRKILVPEAGKSSPREGFLIGVAFTLGMAVVFFFIGLFISNLGIFVRSSRFFDLAAGVLMIVLGISSFRPLGELLEPLTVRLRRRTAVEDDVRMKKSIMEQFINISVGLFKHSAFLGAFTLGVFFALGWAPCAVSLVFPVLIWLLAQNVSPITGGLMLFVFGVGHGVPIIPISTFSRSFCGAIGERYIAFGKWISGGFGVLIIVTGMVFAARYFGYAFW